MSNLIQSEKTDRNQLDHIPTRLQPSQDHGGDRAGPAWKKQAKLKLQQALGKIKPNQESHETSSLTNAENFSNVDPSILKTSTKQNLQQQTVQNSQSNFTASHKAADQDKKNKKEIFAYNQPEKSTRSIQNKYDGQYTGETHSYLEKEYMQDRPYKNWLDPQEEQTERSRMSYQALLSPYVDYKGGINESHRFGTNSYLDKEIDSKLKSAKYSMKEPSEYYRSVTKNTLYLDEQIDRFSERERSKYNEFRPYSFNQETDIRKLLTFEKQSGENKENLSHYSGSYTTNPQSLDYKKSKVGDILSDMKASQEKLKKSYYSYKFERFQYYLNKVFVKVELQYKKAAFQALLQKYYEQDVVLSKFFERQEKKLRALCFYGWQKVIKDEEQFLLNDDLKEKKADAFYERNLLKKYFCQGMQSFLLKARGEKEYNEVRQMVQEIAQDERPIRATKQQKREESPVRVNLEQLARELSFNSQEEEEEQSWENEEEEHKNENKIKHKNDIDEDKGFSPPELRNVHNYMHENWDYENQSLSTERIDNNIPMPEKLEKENMSFSDDEHDQQDWSIEEHREENLKKKQANPRQNLTPNKKKNRQNDENQGNQQSDTKENQHKPTIQELEERARQRREKVLEIKRKKNEIKMQKEREREEEEERQREEIRRKQLEEKKKTEQKKREEREKERKKQLEEKRMGFMFEEAEKFHRKALMKYFGMNAWKQVLQERLQKEQEADTLYNNNMKKITLYNWKEGIRIIEAEKNAEIQHSLLIAQEYRDRKIKKRAFKALKLNLNEAQEANSVHRGHIERLIMGQYIKRWNQVLDELKKEKFEVEAANDKIVNKFRFEFLGKKVFDCWKIYVNEEKRDKFKKMQKDYLWGKVNNWLSEYNQKKKTNESPDDK